MYLIIGGDSTIGKALSKYWTAKNINYISTTRNKKKIKSNKIYFDLNNSNWSELNKYKFDVVIFCAGCTNLEYCENNPLESSKINVKATIDGAKYFSKNNSHLIFLSSTQVFDGSQPKRKITDENCPINEYGRQKVKVENYFRTYSKSTILRLSKIIHKNMPLIKKWEKELKLGNTIDAFINVRIAPVSLEEVVLKINKIINNKKYGLFHLSSQKDITYYEFALEYFKLIKNKKKLIKKNYSVEYNKQIYGTLKKNI